jgi:hypothetical protein
MPRSFSLQFSRLDSAPGVNGLRRTLSLLCLPSKKQLILLYAFLMSGVLGSRPERSDCVSSRQNAHRHEKNQSFIVNNPSAL